MNWQITVVELLFTDNIVLVSLGFDYCECVPLHVYTHCGPTRKNKIPKNR